MSIRTDQLIEAVADAAFECGQWSDEDGGSYDEVSASLRQAKEELRQHVNEIERRYLYATALT